MSFFSDGITQNGTIHGRISAIDVPWRADMDREAIIGMAIVLVLLFLPDIIAKIRGIKVPYSHNAGEGNTGLIIWFARLAMACGTKTEPKKLDETKTKSKK
jgi:hypothetical protein